MPTFENGWICRECWSANREFDSRCYRCHKDRPEVGEPVELAGQGAATPRAPTVLATTAEPSADGPFEVAAPGAATAARADVRYCLRCGHQLLHGASFCTRCGTAAASDEVVDPVPATQAVLTAPATVQRGAGPSIPAIKLPNLPRLPSRELVARLPVLYSSFIERHATQWETVMSSFAMAFVLMQLLPRWLPTMAGMSGSLAAGITGVFLLEYATRLGAAADPRSFVRHHLLELAAILPPLRALRILRLTWIRWLEPGWRLVAGRLALPSRPRWLPPRGQTTLLIGWSMLLILTVALVWSVGSGDQGPLFALLVTCLAVFGGVTGSMVTVLAMRYDARPSDAAAVTPKSASLPAPVDGAASPAGQSA